MEYSRIKQDFLEAALPHVPFDGWSHATFVAAQTQLNYTPAMVQAVCPRGAIDLALAYHLRGDELMLAALLCEDLGDMRLRDRIAHAVRIRIQLIGDKEILRHSIALFSLPHYAADGANSIWGTADKIWTALHDHSDDINWYTKRMTLSAVYGSAVLYWLGDDSTDHQASWDFLDRRIENVMQFEKFKGNIKKNPILSRLGMLPNALLGRIRAPECRENADLPGQWGRAFGANTQE